MKRSAREPRLTCSSLGATSLNIICSVRIPLFIAWIRKRARMSVSVCDRKSLREREKERQRERERERQRDRETERERQRERKERERESQREKEREVEKERERGRERSFDMMRALKSNVVLKKIQISFQSNWR